MRYRISGHESFPFRYTWLPKAVRCLNENPATFSTDAEAMVALGVGKNMVRSIRFWTQAAGIAESASRGKRYELTEFGQALLGTDGLDPFLEDTRTLWLLHWKLSTGTEPLLAWDYVLNRSQEPELFPSSLVIDLKKEALRHQDKMSAATIEQHFQTFIHTYVPTRGRKGEIQEDNLDCPLVELGFIINVGERNIRVFRRICG